MSGTSSLSRQDRPGAGPASLCAGPGESLLVTAAYYSLKPCNFRACAGMYRLDRLCPDRVPGFRHKSYLRPTRLGKKWPATFRGVVIGRDQLELWARGVETFPAAIPSNYGRSA